MNLTYQFKGTYSYDYRGRGSAVEGLFILFNLYGVIK
jgi:hypothetical protein